jgi:hypothetical protein
MIDRERLFPAKFLNATNFPAPKGAVFEIEDVRLEAVGREREEKLVLDLVGVAKPLVINKTNFDVLCDLFGEEERDWIGQSIFLRVAPSKFNGTPSIIASAPSKTARLTESTGSSRSARPEPEPEPAADNIDEAPSPDDLDWEVADAE